MFWRILLCICILFVFKAQASPVIEGVDYRASVSGQEYPLGGLASGVFGYGKPLWQETEDGSDFWKYGYVRAQLQWQTAVVTNRLTGSFEFFPISFFGMSGGGGTDFRNYHNFTGVNCWNLQCDGELSFKYVQMQLLAGYGKVTAAVIGRYDWLRASSGEKPFYDYMSYLIGRPGSDELRSLTVVILHRQSENYSFGALSFLQDMIFSGGNYESAFAIMKYNQGPWQMTAGLGEYRSDHQALGPSALFEIQYAAKKGIGLLN